jgi:hypothetical protein
MLEYPPSRIVAGDTAKWRFSDPRYTPGDGWALSYRLSGAGVALTIASTASGSDFIVEATAAATAAVLVTGAGIDCTLSGFVTKGAERYTVFTGPVRLLPNPATATGDIRGPAALLLEAVEALIAGRATKDQASYKYNGRELVRLPMPELLALRDHAYREAQREAAANSVNSGRPRPRAVYVRFGRS